LKTWKSTKVSELEPLNGVPIGAALGDQQAALFGQGCYSEGAGKNTYGTGSFLLVNVGDEPCYSEDLLTTIGFSWKGETRYALEGSVYSTGATIQWLRDGLDIIDEAAESEELARSLDGTMVSTSYRHLPVLALRTGIPMPGVPSWG